MSIDRSIDRHSILVHVPRIIRHGRRAWALKRARVTNRLQVAHDSDQWTKNALRAITRGSPRSSTRNRDDYYIDRARERCFEQMLSFQTIFRASRIIDFTSITLIREKRWYFRRIFKNSFNSFQSKDIDGWEKNLLNLSKCWRLYIRSVYIYIYILNTKPIFELKTFDPSLYRLEI